MVKFVPHLERFSFNVSKKVGPGRPNMEDDVQLVQFGYFAMSLNAQTKPQLRPFAAAVKTGAKYDGAAGDPLTIAIREHQKVRGGTQDGHISSVPATNEFYDPKHGFQIVALTNLMFDLMPADFPRIDKHTQCPPVLSAKVKELFKR